MISILAIGCGLTGLGPTVMLLIFVVSRRAPLVIIAFVSAFFWLLSILISSLVWSMFSNIKEGWFLATLGGVSMQELGRVTLVRLYMKTEGVIARASVQRFRGGQGGDRGVGISETDNRGTPSPARGDHHDVKMLLPLNDLSSAVASGVGWGGMHAVIFLGNVLAQNSGLGVAYADECPGVPVVLVSALSALGFVVLDLVLMFAVFAAVRMKDSRTILVVFVLHFLASLATRLNTLDRGCQLSIPVLWIFVFVSSLTLVLPKRRQSLSQQIPSLGDRGLSIQ